MTSRSGRSVKEMPAEDQENIPESIERINTAMINHAGKIADEIKATRILVYVDVIKSARNLKALIKDSRCILAARTEDAIKELLRMEVPEDRIVRVPNMDLTRFSQVKVAALLALSRGMLGSGDRLVCLSGPQA
jgi:hypothetical protein